MPIRLFPQPLLPNGSLRSSITFFALRADLRTSTTMDRDEEKDSWVTTDPFIPTFDYDEWYQWDAESGICTTEGFLGSYGCGDEESRASHYPTGDPNRLRGGSRGGTVTSTRGSDRLGPLVLTLFLSSPRSPLQLLPLRDDRDIAPAKLHPLLPFTTRLV